jgi:hypothetical protein
MSDQGHLVVLERCPVCGQGRVLIAVTPPPKNMFVICEDCESEWDSPEAACAALHPVRDQYPFIRFAALDDVEMHSWRVCVLRTYP